MKEYDIVIGLETHVQLKTESKMFCRTSAQYFGNTPNSHTCPVCLGLPGALPVINEKAIESAVKIGLALNCQINLLSRFDRKNYFYPDLAKGFQISQLELPISINGWFLVNNKKIRINRAHMEEDTGKLTHATVDGEKASLVDFNRCGVPLLEIVTEPDLSSPEEAKLYAKTLHQTLRYLGVADADMEKAGMRFDANISLRPKGQKEYGTKVEIKNINSFSYLEKALFFEISRQLKLLEKGEKISQETRGWDETSGETKSQRSKEGSPDYRYFPEPDLPPLTFSKDYVEKIRRQLPEMPAEKKARFVEAYALSDYDASLLTESFEQADWFEQAVKDYARANKEEKIESSRAKIVANWMNGEIARNLKNSGKDLSSISFEPAALVELLFMIDNGSITAASAKEVLEKMFVSGEMPRKIVEEEDLSTLGNKEELADIVVSTLKTNQKAVDDFKAGKTASFSFLLGQVMRQAKGKADPGLAAELLKEKLS
ncbi:MAG: Asp-tRNA(Asn)/Glu-tRNA(Gln) amidotransferase subunit GatB [bacterium]|nr:Asp-tRNA(Asn)/Glu-tRNA(Gln) amidotransferase subunit GatB [bacterium]